MDFGYDLHAVSITEAMWTRIERGQPVVVGGQGFPVEGVMEPDHWEFNLGGLGTIHVSTDEGRELFEGQLGDPEVAVRRESCG